MSDGNRYLNIRGKQNTSSIIAYCSTESSIPIACLELLLYILPGINNGSVATTAQLWSLFRDSTAQQAVYPIAGVRQGQDSMRCATTISNVPDTTSNLNTSGWSRDRCIFSSNTIHVPDVALAELPPIRLPFSIKATVAPALDASIEAASPASPPPTTTTGSYLTVSGTRYGRSR